jgi:hypothetical protein
MWIVRCPIAIDLGRSAVPPIGSGINRCVEHPHRPLTAWLFAALGTHPEILR